MGYRYKLDVDGLYAARPKDLQDIQRESFKYIGKYWHKHYKAIKFTRRAMKKYDFTPRHGDPGSGHGFKGSYQESKLKKEHFFSKAKGHGFNQSGPLPIGEVKPNVYAGRSRASAMSSNQVVATAKNSGHGEVKIIINAPRLHLHPPSGRVRPHLEVVRVASDEWIAMNSAINRYFESRLLKLRRKKTIPR